ncbi:MAG TPA: S9 family peptidase [Candidatus Methylomirabilis sp.]|nr:S9 family peptidase [Candidatus Methylomirabilis sp.]
MNRANWTGVLAAAFATLTVCTLVGAAAAQEQPAAEAGKKLTPEASLDLRTISDLQFSPDGTRIAFVVTEPPRGERRARHIWMYDRSSGTIRQFTFSAKEESSPRWSPDGRQLAFLSNRDDQQQIYILQMSGGEGATLTKGKRSIRTFSWSPDGKQIAFLAPDAKTDAQEKKEKDKDDARVVDKDDKHARLWMLNVATKEEKALTDPKWEVNELAWLPSGHGLVLAATDHPESDEETNRIFTIGDGGGTLREIYAPHGPFGGMQVSPDGTTVSYTGSRGDGPSPHDLMLLDINSKATRNLTGAGLDRAIFEHRWTKEGSLLASYADGFKNKLGTFSPNGTGKPPAELPDNNLANFAVSASGDVAFVSQSFTTPQELWLWNQKGAPRQVSHLNDSWKEFALAKPEIYKYKSFDGLEIEAALLKPVGADGKSKLPVIALIHGGPTGKWSDSIETWGQLLASRGYAIFYPNIRGSIGYGERFVEMNRGDWGGADFRDVMAGVKDLIDRGIADPARLGIGGWSYGGYMSEWAITQTNEFKAAVSGAGLSDLISEYGTEQHPSYDEWFYGVPYEAPTGFLNSSPFLHLKNAKTPTLILQGEADTTDPIGQSQELYRGLKRYGVQTELVLYPREPHGFREEKHLVDRLNRILAWYQKYM